MKKSVPTIVLIIGMLAAPFALTAKNGECAGIKSCHARADIPVPSSVFKPAVVPLPVESVVIVEFTDEATGKPVALNSVSAMPDVLAIPFEVMVAQWEFAPVRISKGRELTVGVSGKPADISPKNSTPTALIVTPKVVVAK